MPYLAGGFLVMFGLTGHVSMADSLMRIPLGLQEMVLAVGLIGRGFRPAAIPSESATRGERRGTPRERLSPACGEGGSG